MLVIPYLGKHIALLDAINDLGMLSILVLNLGSGHPFIVNIEVTWFVNPSHNIGALVHCVGPDCPSNTVTEIKKHVPSFMLSGFLMHSLWRNVSLWDFLGNTGEKWKLCLHPNS
jgi:hypothetical protein